jgi:SAM-dependent methyltransferase
MFKHPVLSSAEYMGLYRGGVATQWSGLADREDWRIIRDMVSALAGAPSVLDIGCGTGDFLANLPPRCVKYGIEPSPAAAHARERGIAILGADLDDVPASLEFDCITIIDVIEHVVDPSELLSVAYARLAPGGRIIVSTGDPEARAWRSLFGPRFWYASFPEHISFPSSEFVRKWCETRNALAGEKRATRYQSLGAARLVLSFAAQIGFYVSPGTFNGIGRLAAAIAGGRSPRRRMYSPGIPGVFVDHHILTVQRPT